MLLEIWQLSLLLVYGIVGQKKLENQWDKVSVSLSKSNCSVLSLCLGLHVVKWISYWLEQIAWYWSVNFRQTGKKEKSRKLSLKLLAVYVNLYLGIFVVM